jgi:hypothetical protein
VGGTMRGQMGLTQFSPTWKIDTARLRQMTVRVRFLKSCSSAASQKTEVATYTDLQNTCGPGIRSTYREITPNTMILPSALNFRIVIAAQE